MPNVTIGGGISKEQLEKQQDETFNKRSEVHTFYRGGDPGLMTDQTQKEWLDSVAKYPTYLNCTMTGMYIELTFVSTLPDVTNTRGQICGRRSLLSSAPQLTTLSNLLKSILLLDRSVVMLLAKRALSRTAILQPDLTKFSTVLMQSPTKWSKKIFVLAEGTKLIPKYDRLPIFAPTYSGKKMKPSFDPTQTWDLPDNIFVSEQAEGTTHIWISSMAFNPRSNIVDAVTSIQGSFVFNDVESYQGWVKERSTSSALFGLFKKSKESLKVITNYFEKSQSRIISLDYRSLYKMEFAPIASMSY